MVDEQKTFKKYIRTFWVIYGISVLFVIFLFFMIAQGRLGFMPSFEELENPENYLATEVISADGKVLGSYFKQENRLEVSYEEFTPDLIHALLCTEDVRFYRHSGIDLRGLLRVFKGILTGDSSSGGGSTISQQLAKMLFPRENSNKLQLIVRKFKEWVIAVKLEKSYTKEEILTMYLNKYDFLNLAVGIKSASQIYFNSSPDSLKLHEVAMLVGMAKNSSLYNPVRREELTRKRRNVVLSQMRKYDYITREQYDSLTALPLGLDYQKVDFKSGLAPYLREYLRITLSASKPDRSKYASWQYQKFKEDSSEWETNSWYGWCRKNFKPDGSNYDIYKDGIKIYTTIDSRMQRYAEEAVTEHLKLDLQPDFDAHLKTLRNPPFPNGSDREMVENLLDRSITQSERYRLGRLAGLDLNQIKKKFNEPVEMTVFTWDGDKDTIMSPIDSIKHYLSFFRSSFMAMDLATGQVKAYVGGPNYKHFMYDMVKGGKRQVGSTVKPFLYTLAMQNGLSPCTKVPNVRQQFILPDGNIWEAKNSSPQREGEMVTLKWGLANSVNQISAWVMKQYNPQAVVNVMKKMGVYSPIDPVPSMFLGTSDITLYEMVGAYGTFGNKGVYTQPFFVTHIEDKHGNVIARFKPERHVAIDEQTAYLMINLMRGVIEGGSGGRLRWHEIYGRIEGPIAGKTGTTQNHSDGWFCGVTPQIAAAAWTGADLRSVHFDNISEGQGANMALPIWGRFMKKVYADETLPYKPDAADFEKPMNFTINLDCDEENNTQSQPTRFEDFF
ncbi:MAG: penicillin-binding protein [Bacteroidetes bacterium GWF2_42_66]|nr:MAG: penicillin-binding protein [Bacteroidetes bacterium GWA2_42_15]OFX98525.1 MAG: penicillin-binding protein [Bacteroidetes bacterium GWE2_42_39]OFY42907.1 MAG: penicillin-binding protein [Bacteroidetes bacterium GWF2_42_66]HBL74388.1 penicillin-binding protein [Prolixibacteraceae bacterium]HCR92229.1 penicillin-binding protein [Prolixibacteraceae bacterium]